MADSDERPKHYVVQVLIDEKWRTVYRTKIKEKAEKQLTVRGEGLESRIRTYVKVR